MVGRMSEKKGGVYCKLQCFDWEFSNRFDRRKDGVDDSGGSFTHPAFPDWAEYLRILLFQKEPGKMEVSRQGVGICGDEGVPNDALLYALGHLGLRDLLSVEKVCKSLRFTIENDVLLWKTIRIDRPLSAQINDDSLLRLTNRAQGNLLCLSIAGCFNITDNGLKRVLERNPRLTKLNVAGCTRLSDDGIVNNLKTFKSSSSGKLGINQLRIGSRCGITRVHFEEIKCLVGTDKCNNEPHYYHCRDSCEDDRAIDIDICPKCENLNIVYDCPAKSCQGKQQSCRGCIICISRCVECGRCVNDSEYVEMFNLDIFCLECWKTPRSMQERQDAKGAALL